jgi:hypothetical protein
VGVLRLTSLQKFVESKYTRVKVGTGAGRCRVSRRDYHRIAIDHLVMTITAVEAVGHYAPRRQMRLSERKTPWIGLTGAAKWGCGAMNPFRRRSVAPHRRFNLGGIVS